MKKVLLGLILFFFSTIPSIAQEVRVDCENFAGGVYQMATYADTHPKATSKDLLESVGLGKKELENLPKEMAQLALLSTRMILSQAGRQYHAEDHGHGALGLCENHEGNIKEMNEVILQILKLKEV